jgi:glucose/arabinose dehydrogenase
VAVEVTARRAVAAAVVVAAALALPASATAAVGAKEVGRFNRPVYVHGPEGADGLLFVVERPGRIEVLVAGKQARRPFLNITQRVSCCAGERGLFSVAFAPDYATSRRFYVYFTDRQGDLRVEEYRSRGDDQLRARKGSRRKVIEIRHRRYSNHNGGQLQFGPDGHLYMATGDGGSFGDPSENAQSKGSLLGKLLRIDPTPGKRRRGHGVPRSNPYVNGNGENEIYARGLRNPWRFSFDGNRIVIADVGQDRREEIDYETIDGARGANFGWDAFEGSSRYRSPDASRPPKRHSRPIAEYGHGGGRCSITGGYVVRDPSLPALRGRYVYGDLCSGEIRSLVPELEGGRDDRRVAVPAQPGLATFGEDAAGRVYYASASSGRVFMLVQEG